MLHQEHSSPLSRTGSVILCSWCRCTAQCQARRGITRRRRCVQFDIMPWMVLLTCSMGFTAVSPTAAFCAVRSPLSFHRRLNRRMDTTLTLRDVSVSSMRSSSRSETDVSNTLDDDPYQSTINKDEQQLNIPDAESVSLDEQQQLSSPSGSEPTNKTEIALQQIVMQTIGTVNDERYVFPEYASGDVPRLFSSLQYRTTTPTAAATLENDASRETNSDVGVTMSSGAVVTTTTATHAAGSVLAASALVTGTTVGAGVLALPTATAASGLIPSTVAMLVGYAIMTISGLLLAELVLNRIGQTGKPSTTGVMDLYKASFGTSFVSIVSQLAYFFLHYALMVAYIAQGGIILADSASISELLPSSTEWLGDALGQVLFAGSMATMLFAASKSTLEKVNNVLVAGVYITFASTLILAAQTAEYFPSLWDPSNQHPEQVLDAFPVIFLAFVYQNIVPVIVKDLEGDRNKITQAILIGTTVPLLMFVAWNAVVLAHIAPGTDLSTVNAISLLQETGGSDINQLLAPLVASFSVLAITTSLIGFTYGLLDAWTDVFKLDVSSSSSQQWKLPLFGLIFVPPLLLAVGVPDVFQTALEYGGAFGVSTLFLVLPPLMVWNERYGDHEPLLVAKPMVPLGKIPLVVLWLASTILIVQQSIEKFGGVVDVLQGI